MEICGWNVIEIFGEGEESCEKEVKRKIDDVGNFAHVPTNHLSTT